MEGDAAEVSGVFSEVEYGESGGAVLEWLGPYLDGAFRVDAVALFAERVLIDGDDLAVGENGGDLGRDGGEIVAGEEGAASMAQRVM